MHPTDLLGLAAGALTTVSFLPQVARIWRRRSAADLSYGWLVTFTLGVALWLAYGIQAGAAPVIAANSITLALVLLILYFKLRYR